MSDRTRLGIHTTCTNRRARGPRARTIGPSRGYHSSGTISRGKPSFSAPDSPGDLKLKKDNRPLIYDLGSLVQSPSTFFLSPVLPQASFSLPPPFVLS